MKPEQEDLELMEVFGYTLIRNGKWKKAGVLIRTMVMLWPDYGPAHRMLSYVYLHSGEPAKALAEAVILQDLIPGDPAGFLLKSRALWALGRTEDAASMFSRYMEALDER